MNNPIATANEFHDPANEEATRRSTGITPEVILGKVSQSTLYALLLFAAPELATAWKSSDEAIDTCPDNARDLCRQVTQSYWSIARNLGLASGDIPRRTQEAHGRFRHCVDHWSPQGDLKLEARMLLYKGIIELLSATSQPQR